MHRCGLNICSLSVSVFSLSLSLSLSLSTLSSFNLSIFILHNYIYMISLSLYLLTGNGVKLGIQEFEQITRALFVLEEDDDEPHQIQEMDPEAKPPHQRVRADEGAAGKDQQTQHQHHEGHSPQTILHVLLLEVKLNSGARCHGYIIMHIHYIRIQSRGVCVCVCVSGDHEWVRRRSWS